MLSDLPKGLQTEDSRKSLEILLGLGEALAGVAVDGFYCSATPPLVGPLRIVGGVGDGDAGQEVDRDMLRVGEEGLRETGEGNAESDGAGGVLHHVVHLG